MESTRWSVRTAESVMQRHPILGKKWTYEWGVVLKGILEVWRQTGDPRYFDYIRRNMDAFVQADGCIRTYRAEDYNLDMLNTGKLLFPLYQATGDERYKIAIEHLADQLAQQPRTAEGGFWHKHIYPQQMWLDGIYMASPFYAEYARTFNQPAIFDDIAYQITLIVERTYDPATGLLYHGWDSSRQQAWAHPETGCSPHFWGRAIGWFVMALPDILDYFPMDHPTRGRLIAIFHSTIQALLRVQDVKSGLWYQVLDRAGAPGNYLEASATAMFIYAIARGVEHGYLDNDALRYAQQAFDGMLRVFIEVDDRGLVDVTQICGVAGLGGDPYRPGTYEYYISEPIVTNDEKGVGAFILGCAALEKVQDFRTRQWADAI